MHQPINKKKLAWQREQERKQQEIAKCYESYVPKQIRAHNQAIALAGGKKS